MLNDREACLSCGLEKAKALLKSDDMGAIIVISAFRVKDFGGGDDEERAWPVPIHQVFFEDRNQTEINHQHNGVVFKVIWVSKVQFKESL